MPDEQIVIELTLEDRTAIENAKAYRAEIERIKTEMRALAQQGKVSFSDLSKGILMSQQEIAKIAKISPGKLALDPKALVTAERNILDATKELNKEAAKGTTVWGRFKDAINTAIGIGLYRLVHQAINFIKSLMEAGEEAALTVFRLGTAIHALQRMGTAVTVTETLKMVRELRKEYGVFTTQEIMGGVANIMLLSRSFKFASDQMRTMLEISADLAIVLGKDMNDAAKELALFISSGYGEALQRAGIAVNRLSVVQEAWRMGIKKSYMELTEAERAQAAYNLLAAHAADLHEDALKYQDDIIGKIRAQKAEVENLTNAIGLGLLPAEAKLLKAKVALYNVGIWVINQLITGFGRMITVIAEVGLAAGITGHNIKAALTFHWDELIDPKGFLEAFSEVWNVMDKGIEEAKIEPLDMEKLLETWQDYSGD
ncbi:MAG: hypothetical protein KJ556_21575, partial [Gammaproteobacteria bacterium]|nr:hypothetical protein [Gammaproteobacteria bacterium]